VPDAEDDGWPDDCRSGHRGSFRQWALETGLASCSSPIGVDQDDPAYWDGGDRDSDGYACDS